MQFLQHEFSSHLVRRVPDMNFEWDHRESV